MKTCRRAGNYLMEPTGRNFDRDKLYIRMYRSYWPRSLRRESAAAHLPGLWVRIPPGTCMSVSFESCVFSGRGLLRRADHSSRGVLSNVVCLSVISKPRKGGHYPESGWSATGKYIYKKVVKLSYCVYLVWQMTTAQQYIPGLSITLSLPSEATIRQWGETIKWLGNWPP